MTDDPVLQRLREISWRRALTSAEQAELKACLKAHPEIREEWAAEMALTASLTQLPEPAVPSNFTSRVLQAVKREALAESRSPSAGTWWQKFAHKARWAMGTSFAAVVALSGLLFHGYHVHQRQELAKSVMLVSGADALPNADVLTNFEAIRALNQAPPPDEQLLALLE